MGRYITGGGGGGIPSGGGSGGGGPVSIAGEFGQGFWQVFESPFKDDSFTWTVPLGVSSIRIRCFGGGAWEEVNGGTASCLGVSATGGNKDRKGGQGSGGDIPYNYTGGDGGFETSGVEYRCGGGGGSANIFGNGGAGGRGDTDSAGSNLGQYGASGGGGGFYGYSAGGACPIASQGKQGARSDAAGISSYARIGGKTGTYLSTAADIDMFRCGAGGAGSDDSILAGGNGGGVGGRGGTYLLYGGVRTPDKKNTSSYGGGGFGGGGFGGGSCGTINYHQGRGGGGFAMGVREVTPGQEISIVCGVRAAVIIEW